jgi:hypothetical protein
MTLDKLRQKWYLLPERLKTVSVSFGVGLAWAITVAICIDWIVS